MKTLGFRHIALQVQDPQKSKDFYMRVLKMTLEWEPDPENIYLTNDQHDNLALHKAPGPLSGGRLDHVGIALPSVEDIQAWYAWVKSQGVKIVHELKTHRDGATSFYISDPDGIIIQMIHHPPIADRYHQMVKTGV